MMQAGQRQLAHHWVMEAAECIPAGLLDEFLEPAVAAVPSSLARRLGRCRITLLGVLEPDIASRWVEEAGGLEITLATAEIDAHDVAMELLVCLGQALWDRLSPAELAEYWKLLDTEISAGVAGEIDEPAGEEKRRLLAAPSQDLDLLEEYGRASFAGTAAEYVHCLWHEVTIRTGPEHLPARELRRRLELLARWFPPGRGYRLFPGPAAQRSRPKECHRRPR